MKSRPKGRLGLMGHWRKKMSGVNRFVEQFTHDVLCAWLMNEFLFECLDSFI